MDEIATRRRGRRSVTWGPRERRLLVEARRDGDRRAIERLFEEMLPLAGTLARKYNRSPGQLDDLMQVASLALFKALQRFDPERGVDFPAFAVPTIIGELRRYYRDYGWSVRPPRALQERARKVNRQLNVLSTELGRSPTVTELATRCELSVEEVLEGRQAAAAHVAMSLDITDDEESANPAPVQAIEEPGYRHIEEAEALRPAIRVLPERERYILALRFEEGLTQHEIANRVGLSQMHVSRLLRRALERLEPLLAAAA
jgi:RNA polymerase sigma-B factor